MPNIYQKNKKNFHIFEKINKTKKMAKSNNGIESPSINLIGKETHISGDINSNGNIRIDGTVKGNIKCTARIVIGNSAKIEGDIFCKNCEISGYLKGNIKIEETLCLKETSKMEGNIITNKLNIEPGAIFTGSCKMGKDDNGKTLSEKEKA